MTNTKTMSALSVDALRRSGLPGPPPFLKGGAGGIRGWHRSPRRAIPPPPLCKGGEEGSRIGPTPNADRANTKGYLAGGLAALLWIGGLGVATATGFTRGLLFEVSGAGPAPSYLFGTIHSDDPRVLALPVRVQTSFDLADGFVMEAVPDPEAVEKARRMMTFNDGRRLSAILPLDIYRQVADVAARRGLTAAAIEPLKPWALVTLLSAPPSRSGEFLDLLLYRTAQEQGKPVAGLETLSEQMGILDGLTDAEQVALLRDTLATIGELVEVHTRLVAAYVRRDLDALIQLDTMYRRWGSPELAQRVNELAIDERNARMAERLRPLLNQGGRFIAIGALHLPGPKGLLQRLVDAGLVVRVLY